MSTNPTIVTATITRFLNGYGGGDITARKLAGQTNLGLREVNDALIAMEAVGTVTRTPGPINGNRTGADLWCAPNPAPDPTDATATATAVPTDTTDAEPTTDDDAMLDAVPAVTGDGAADDTEPIAGDDTMPDDEGTPQEAPVSGAPVSGAPVGTADHLKVVMVAGVLGDHPDGVSAADIGDETGLRAAIVAKVLVAMEAAGAAGRQPAADGGVELWLRADGDLTTVSLINTPTFTECPTCHHRSRVRVTVGVNRTGAAASGHNSDGSQTLGKNELRTLVRDFLNAHTGHEFNAGTIARELGRSSGAVGNALAKLVVAGEADLVSEAPMRYSGHATPVTDDDVTGTDATGTDEAGIEEAATV